MQGPRTTTKSSRVLAARPSEGPGTGHGTRSSAASQKYIYICVYSLYMRSLPRIIKLTYTASNDFRFQIVQIFWNFEIQKCHTTSHESIVSYQIQIKKKLRTLQSPRKARDSLRVFEIWTSPAYIVVQWEAICSLTGLCCSQERSKSRKLGGCGALVVFTGELWVFLKAEKCAPRVGKRRRTRRIPKTYFCETARFCWDFSENMCESILKSRPQRGYRERRADIFA